MPCWTRVAASRAASANHSLLSASAWLHLAVALGLSPREMQIVQGVFEDYKEAAIAAEMGISPHTVNTYFQRLYRKMHVCSRPQLIVRVMAEYFALTAPEPGRSDGEPAANDQRLPVR